MGPGMQPDTLLYASPADREDRVDVLHDVMAKTGLATLVTAGERMLHATHLPIVLERSGNLGIVRGHVARGNVQWSDLNAAVPALAIFRLASAYISPSWYATTAQTGRNVPTYDYIAVHAAGTIAFFDDVSRLRPLVEQLTERFEAQFEKPWSVADAPADYIEMMLRGIVGFELMVEALTGSVKLSDARGQADRDGVVAGLSASTRAEDRLVADLIRDRPHS
jgi:transcriptional regulator